MTLKLQRRWAILGFVVMMMACSKNETGSMHPVPEPAKTQEPVATQAAPAPTSVTQPPQ
ncbi:hypothetical protein LLG95_16915 [bacterium]|nr:hypothetical protein [bacterium]